MCSVVVCSVCQGVVVVLYQIPVSCLFMFAGDYIRKNTSFFVPVLSEKVLEDDLEVW